MSQSYDEVKEEVKSEQQDLSYSEIKEMMQKQSDFMVEMDNLKPRNHRWVDRGQIMSCEGMEDVGS